MKSMKSVKLFLFSVGAILTVLFAIAVSKPHNTVSIGSNFVSDKSYSVNADLAEDTATVYDNSDLSESESEEVEENTTDAVFESELSVTVSQKETSTAQSNTFTTQRQEQTVTNAKTTLPRETAKPTAPQTQRETAEKPSSPPVTTTSNDHEQMTVYYTKTGERYHYANPCGRGTYYPTTLAEAKKRGLTPCQKCVH